MYLLFERKKLFKRPFKAFGECRRKRSRRKKMLLNLSRSKREIDNFYDDISLSEQKHFFSSWNFHKRISIEIMRKSNAPVWKIVLNSNSFHLDELLFLLLDINPVLLLFKARFQFSRKSLKNEISDSFFSQSKTL